MLGRRGFLKGLAGAAALALSPVMLNTARLALADPSAPYYAGKRYTYRFRPGDGTINELGFMSGDPAGSAWRIHLPQPVTVLADEEVEVAYRFDDQGNLEVDGCTVERTL